MKTMLRWYQGRVRGREAEMEGRTRVHRCSSQWQAKAAPAGLQNPTGSAACWQSGESQVAPCWGVCFCPQGHFGPSLSIFPSVSKA